MIIPKLCSVKMKTSQIIKMNLIQRTISNDNKKNITVYTSRKHLLI